ncbi:MAG: universal stress protein [Chloroflexi bacterium]|nr:universal stress protein [Chloroflexota bacterium]
MYDRILVPLDGSQMAEQVLPYALLLAKGFRSRVALFRVIEPMQSSVADPDQIRHLDQVVADLHAKGESYLQGITLSPRDTTEPASLKVVEGDPASQIVGEADKDPNTLLAMSTHGRSGVTRWLIGSVTDKVLLATDKPLLLVRAKEEKAPTLNVNLRTLVVPLDGSPLAEEILPHAAALAKALSLNVVLLNVIPDPKIYYDYVNYPAPSYEFSAKEMEAPAKDYLQSIAQKLRLQGTPSVEQKVVHGDPASAIVDLTTKMPDCLVAMTTHGRSGLSRWIMGSVTDRVVRHSEKPVLVIRGVEEKA